jgi:hypothetical protein
MGLMDLLQEMDLLLEIVHHPETNLHQQNWLMALQETMDPHPEMNLHQKALMLREMMLVRVKNPLQKVQMRANPLQRLLQMDQLREMELLLAILLLQEMRLLQEIPLHLLGLLLRMRQKLKHPQLLPLLLRQMPLHPHHLQ